MRVKRPTTTQSYQLRLHIVLPLLITVILHLTLSCKELTNQGVRGCVSQIGQIITLEELTLNFSGYLAKAAILLIFNKLPESWRWGSHFLCLLALRAEEFEELRSQLLRVFKKIFGIFEDNDLIRCKNITDKGILDLTSRFEKNILQNLYLNFSE